jgi:hypothetical protein
LTEEGGGSESTYGEEVEHGKELVGAVVVLEHVSSRAERDQQPHQGDQNRRSPHIHLLLIMKGDMLKDRLKKGATAAADMQT